MVYTSVVGLLLAVMVPSRCLAPLRCDLAAHTQLAAECGSVGRESFDNSMHYKRSLLRQLIVCYVCVCAVHE